MYTVQSIKDLYQVLIELNIVKEKNNSIWVNRKGEKVNSNWLNLKSDLFLNSNYYFRGQSGKYKMVNSNVHFVARTLLLQNAKKHFIWKRAWKTIILFNALTVEK